MKTDTDPTTVTNGSLLALDAIEPSPFQPRTAFHHLEELAASFQARAAQALPPNVVAVLVRPHPKKPGRYELVDGERRVRAARMAKLEALKGDVQELTDEQVREIQLTSFLREDLSDLEEAAAFKQLVELQPGKTLDEKVAALETKLGKKRSTILGRMALLKLPAPAREALAKGEIPQSAAQLIATQPLAEAQKALLAEARRGSSIRQLKEFAANRFNIDLSKAPFNPEDPALDCFGPCSQCEFYGQNLAAKFPDLKLAPETCTNGDGYAKKVAAQTAKLRTRYEAEGFTVLPDAEVKKTFQYSYGSDEPGHNSPYVAGGKKEWNGKEFKNWSDILGKHAPKPVIALHQGRPVKLFVEKEVKQIAAEHKLIKRERSDSDSYAASAKRKAEQTRIRKAIESMVVNEAVRRVEEGKLFQKPAATLEFWRLVAAQLACDAWSDRQREIVAGRGLKDVKPHELHKLPAGFTLAQCLGLVFEIAVARGWRDGPAGGGRVKAYELLGVDAKAIEKRERAQLLARRLSRPVRKPAAADKSRAPKGKKKGKKK